MVGETPYFELSSDDFLDPIEGPVKDKEGFYNRILEFIDFNLQSNYNINILCYFVNSKGDVFEATLEPDGYYKSLNKCIAYYEKEEEYEKCIQIKNMIENFRII